MSFTYYYLESMANYKQLEIEKQAREAWKFACKKEDKEQPEMTPKTVKATGKSVLVAPPCCCCEW